MVYWQAGTRLNNDKYIVNEILGSGGFGVTYKITEAKTERLFALKTLNIEAQNRPDFDQLQTKFINEAIALASCPHPNIVRVYPQVFQEQGLWCMVMEYIEGEDLGRYLEKNGKLSEAQAIAIITKVGEALSSIHQKGFLHRDIKPGNILLRSSDLTPVLIDFGLAREFISEQSMSMTNSRTECFAPIEQYQRHGNFGAWTDVYALAATLYALLTARPPLPAKFRYETQYELTPPQQCEPQISDRTNEAILKGMELEYQNRSQSIEEWLELLSGKTLKNACYRLEEIIFKDCLGENEAYNLDVADNAVYLGKEIRSNIPVVIKTIDLERRNNNNLDKAISCLKNEAKLLKQIEQYKIPNIVSYRDSFEENGIFYLVMDFVSGENLYSLVSKKGKLSETEAIDYILQISDAVASCHQKGIFHRDIHPSNIIRTNEGKVVLVDFDVAANPNLSGSPYFQPPYRSKITKSEDIDLYSLAATLYYLVTGVNPASIGIDHSWFDYSENGLKLKQPKHFNPDLSDRINEAILKGMEIEPGDRPDSVKAWLELLKPSIAKITLPSTQIITHDNSGLELVADWLDHLEANEVEEEDIHFKFLEDLLERDDVEFYCDRADEKIENKDYQGAIKDLERAIDSASEPTSESVEVELLTEPFHDAKFYCDRAQEKFDNKDFQGAIEDCTQAIRFNPQNALAHSIRVTAHVYLKDYQGMIEDCESWQN